VAEKSKAQMATSAKNLEGANGWRWHHPATRKPTSTTVACS
jgi:hypothetical protein